MPVRALVGFGSLAAAAGLAHAGFRHADSEFNLTQQTFVEIDGGAATAEDDRHVQSRFSVDQDGPTGPYDFRDRGVLDTRLGSSRANLLTDTFKSLSLNQAEWRFGASGGADADEDGNAFADLNADYRLSFDAEADTELMVTLRLEIEDEGDAVQQAFVRLDGLSSPFELRYDRSGSFMAELSLLITVQAGTSYQIEAGLAASPDARRDASFWSEMGVEVALAPSPGTAAMLGLGGLLAARRRR
ncbi:MAG: hypothetical protein RIB60_00680 [Phycisphaerales bacterium]